MCQHWTEEEKSNKNMIFKENSEYDTKHRKLRDIITVFTHNTTQSFLNTQKDGFGICLGSDEQKL